MKLLINLTAESHVPVRVALGSFRARLTRFAHCGDALYLTELHLMTDRTSRKKTLSVWHVHIEGSSGTTLAHDSASIRLEPHQSGERFFLFYLTSFQECKVLPSNEGHRNWVRLLLLLRL